MGQHCFLSGLQRDVCSAHHRGLRVSGISPPAGGQMLQDMGVEAGGRSHAHGPPQLALPGAQGPCSRWCHRSGDEETVTVTEANVSRIRLCVRRWDVDTVINYLVQRDTAPGKARNLAKQSAPVRDGTKIWAQGVGTRRDFCPHQSTGRLRNSRAAGLSRLLPSGPGPQPRCPLPSLLGHRADPSLHPSAPRGFFPVAFGFLGNAFNVPFLSSVSACGLGTGRGVPWGGGHAARGRGLPQPHLPPSSAPLCSFSV